MSARSNSSATLRALVRAHLEDHAASWSIGGYGAIAEFHWLPDDALGPPIDHHESLRVVTDAGALAIELRDEIVAHAYQSLSRHSDRWLHAVTLCLPWRRARRAQRTLLTELGPDRHAIRAADRDAVLFDLGLGLPHVDACVRSRSPRLLARLRAGCGLSLLEPGNDLMAVIKEASPHRVFVSRLGRVEVFQPIGRAHTQPPTPLGPHTHVLPRLLATGRDSADNHDAPPYHRACAYLYPRHPLVDNLGRRKSFDRDAHARFSALLGRFGDAAFVAEKERAQRAMRDGIDARDYRAATGARCRHAVRIAIRELAHEIGEDELLAAWRRRFDRVRAPSHPHLVH